jgi:hypothetical protein
MRDVYNILVSRSAWMIPLWRPRTKWEDNIKLNSKENICEIVDWNNIFSCVSD